MKTRARRKICVVSGTRADYGLLFWLMKAIQEDPNLILQIVVCGMHLSPEFGLTYKAFESDGFFVNEKIEMLLSSDTPVGISKSIGLGVIGFAEAFERLRPDIVVLLGDRFEILSAAQAALVARIPVAHIHGGEATEGLIDEGIRHATTKLSHIHFVAAEQFKERILKMGENPKFVRNFGAPGLDSIKHLNLLSKGEMENALGLKFGKLIFLVTYHPVTLTKSGPEKTLRALFSALDKFPSASIIFTKSNADTDGRIISSLIDEFVNCDPSKRKAFTSLGQLRYLSLLNHVDASIGNSSSGIIEAPFLKKVTINLGLRQRGRLKASSIIDCEEKAKEIFHAINKGLSQEFQNSLKRVKSLYGNGNASRRIKEFLKTVNLNGILLKKFFESGKL